MMAAASIGSRGYRRWLEIGRQQWLHTGCGCVSGGGGGSSASDGDAQRRAGDAGVEVHGFDWAPSGIDGALQVRADDGG
jgi:hypothetical protein